MSATHMICPKCAKPIPRDARRAICPSCLATSLGSELFGSPGEPGAVDDPPIDVPGYQLHRLLGEGAAGEVWLATERVPPRREVALKILKPELVAGDAAVRFEAEMAALALMDHPGIARVYGSGSTADGRPFFAMERVDGQPITEFCDGAALALRERLTLFQKLCEAIAHAHRRGVIHRDLKPSNVLAAGDTPKVIDFGIAKATEQLLTERTLLTRADVLLGTPAYMSPEQAAMRGDAVDTRTDIYSLGVLLYELLTGSAPFPAEELDELPYDEALHKVRTQDPRRPSARAPGAGIAQDIDWIVMRALEKDPERRYESAGDFARDIGNFLAGDSVEARPPTLNYRLRKYVRRHRATVAAALAIALAMLAGTTVSVMMFLRAERNAVRAEESETRGRRNFSLADFTQARPLLDDRRPALAVAHLARAVRTDPGNRPAAARLLQTLASEDWSPPVFTLAEAGETSRCLFTPDGSLILSAWIGAAAITAGDPVLRMFDAADGSLVRELHFDTDLKDFAISPDGATVFAVTVGGEFSSWDLHRGERRAGTTRQIASSSSQLELSPDGRWVGVAFWLAGHALVLDADSGAVEARFAIEGSRGYLGSIAFADAGDSLVLAQGRSLQVFDIGARRPSSPLMSHGDGIFGVAVLPGDRQLVSWSRDRTARVWDRETGRVVRTFQHENSIEAAALSPDGTRLLTGTAGRIGEPGIARLWDVASGGMIGQPLSYRGPVTCAVFSADGTRAATGARVSALGDRGVQVIDAWDGAPLVAPICHPRGAEELAFSGDGTRLTISSRRPVVAVHAIRLGAQIDTQLRHLGSVWRAIFDDSGERPSVLTLTMGGRAQRWDVRTGAPLSGPETVGPTAVAAHAAAGDDTLRHGFQSRRWIGSYAHSFPLRGSFFRALFAPAFKVGGLHSAAVSDDGQRLVTGAGDGKLRVWSLATGELLYPPLAHGTGAVSAIALDPQSRRAASGGALGMVKIWDLQSGELLAENQVHDAEVSAVAFSPGGDVLATGAADGGSRLWWLGRGTALSPELDNVRRVNHLAFDPAGRLLASSGSGAVVRIADAQTGQLAAPAMRHSAECNFGLFLLWTSDGGRIVSSGSPDNSAKVWDAASGQMRTRPIEHQHAAYAVALQPGADVLLYASSEAALWDLASGEPLTPRFRPGSRIYTAAFDRHGRRLALGTHAGVTSIWDLPQPDTALPGWAIDFAEASGGLRFDSGGVLRPISGESLERLRQQALLATDVSPDGASVANWLHWLASDPGERPISPESEITVAGHVERLVKIGTVDSLRAALHRRPLDPRITAALGVKLVEGSDPGGRGAVFGRFLVARALQGQPDLQVATAKLQFASGDPIGGLLGFGRAFLRQPGDYAILREAGRSARQYAEAHYWHYVRMGNELWREFRSQRRR